jgi:predicted Ser/Thr protein kinase
MVPTRIGPYEIEAELGRGGMGVVYSGRHEELGRRAAIKVLLDDLSEPSAKERFERECQAIARLNHVGIVRVYESGFHEGLPFVALEFVEGPDLKQVLERDGRWEEQAAIHLGLKLCAAIAHAHGLGVLHRDLKPANVLVDPEGEPRVTDFGLARELDAETLTATGAMLGTPSYMPPEQAAGERDRFGPPSDVYGLGATLYEVLTGEPPFRGPLPSLLTHLFTKPAPPPSSLRPDLDPALEAVLLRCLEKDPDDRYPSAAALGEALRACLPGQAPAEPEPRRGGLLVALVSLALLILLSGGIYALAPRADPSGLDPARAAAAEAAWAEVETPEQAQSWLAEHAPHAEPSLVARAEARLADQTWRELERAHREAGRGGLPKAGSLARLRRHEAVRAWAAKHLAQARSSLASKVRLELGSAAKGRALAVLQGEGAGANVGLDSTLFPLFRSEGDRIQLYGRGASELSYDLQSGAGQKTVLMSLQKARERFFKRAHARPGQLWVTGGQYVEVLRDERPRLTLQVESHLVVRDLMALDDALILIGGRRSIPIARVLVAEDDPHRGFLALAPRSRVALPLRPGDFRADEDPEPIGELTTGPSLEALLSHPRLPLWYATGGWEKGPGSVDQVERSGDRVRFGARLKLPAEVECAAISPDATLLAVGMAAGGARVYALDAQGRFDDSRYATLAPVRRGLDVGEVERERLIAQGLCFVPDGRLFMVTRRRGDTRYSDFSAWSLSAADLPASGGALAKPRWATSLPGQTRRFSLSPDATLLAVGSHENRVLLFGVPPLE